MGETMLGVKRQSRLDKVVASVRDGAVYVDQIVGDERLRADLRAAMLHGVEARDRFEKDIAVDRIAMRVATDRKLRKKIRAVLDDLESARDRMRGRSRHRLRNRLLVVGAVGAMTASVPHVRRWIAARMSDGSQAAADVGMSV